MRMLRIDVTVDDLANGTRCSCVFCPVALALARVVRDVAAVVSVSDRKVLIYSRLGNFVFDPAADLREFIESIDRRRVVEPTSFLIPISNHSSVMFKETVL